MDTSKAWARFVRYRKAKCCGTCVRFVDDVMNHITYCPLHDNPVSRYYVCKLFKKPEE